MFCKDRGIDLSVWLCREYARYARPALLGISTLPPRTIGIPTLLPAGANIKNNKLKSVSKSIYWTDQYDGIKVGCFG